MNLLEKEGQRFSLSAPAYAVQQAHATHGRILHGPLRVENILSNVIGVQQSLNITRGKLQSLTLDWLWVL